MRTTSSVLLGVLTAAFIGGANAQDSDKKDIDWKKVDEALGRTAAVAGDVHRYGFPRTDLQVTLDGVTIRPALALGSWAAFKPVQGGAMVMGDLVLLETEINPVMAKLIAERPRDHRGAQSRPARQPLAVLHAYRRARRSGEARDGDPHRAGGEQDAADAAGRRRASPPAIDLDTAQLDQIIGAKGQANGGVYQFAVPRRDPVSEDGMQLTPAGPTGVATAIGFQPTGGGKAAITGDFVLTGEEVNPVIKALRANGIEVTAIHSHMLTEQPRLHLHALLGQRRRGQARQRSARRARQDRKRQELNR